MAGPSNPSAAPSLDPLAGLLDDQWLTEQARQRAPAAGPRSTANAPRPSAGSGRTKREIPRNAPVQQTKAARAPRVRPLASRTGRRTALGAAVFTVIAAGAIAASHSQPTQAPATATLAAPARADLTGALTRASNHLADAERQRARAAQLREQRAAARKRAERRAQQRAAAARKRARAKARAAARADRTAAPAPAPAPVTRPHAVSAPAPAPAPAAPRTSRTRSIDPSSCELGPC